MEYPKYKREEKLSAKLSENDISSLRELRKVGYTFEALANRFGISNGHAYFVCMSKEKLAMRLEQQKKYLKENDNTNKVHAKKCRERKKALQGESLKEYTDERRDIINKNWRKAYYLKKKDKVI